jgi:hypothetical protein
MWYTLARPQHDGSDIPLLNERERARTGWSKATPNTSITFLDGSLAVYAGPHPQRQNQGMSRNAIRAVESDLTPEWVTSFEPYLRTWQVGARALEAYLDEWWVFEVVDDDGNIRRNGAGCSSGHMDMVRDVYPRHAVLVTRTDLQGAAQGIYHEYGHLRLQTLGINIETHDRVLLLNEPTELYNSSVRTDIQRPMSAVLHGVYAWLMFTENDYQLFMGSDQQHMAKVKFELYSKHNVPKIQNGIAEIKAHGRFTPEGAEFIQGVYDWADDLCARCTQVYSA